MNDSGLMAYKMRVLPLPFRRSESNGSSNRKITIVGGPHLTATVPQNLSAQQGVFTPLTTGSWGSSIAYRSLILWFYPRDTSGICSPVLSKFPHQVVLFLEILGPLGGSFTLTQFACNRCPFWVKQPSASLYQRLDKISRIRSACDQCLFSIRSHVIILERNETRYLQTHRVKQLQFRKYNIFRETIVCCRFWTKLLYHFLPEIRILLKLYACYCQ